METGRSGFSSHVFPDPCLLNYFLQSLMNIQSKIDSNHKRNSNWIQIASLLLVCSLAAETGFLIVQNRELKQTIKSLTMPGMESLRPGDKVQPIRVQTLDGSMTDLSYTDPKQKFLVLVFSSGCPHCEKSLPLWNSFVELVKDRADLSILGISADPLETLKSYAAIRKPSFYILSAAKDTSFRRKYGVIGVPETILIKGDGTVVKTWLGELQNAELEEVQTLFLGAVRTSSLIH